MFSDQNLDFVKLVFSQKDLEATLLRALSKMNLSNSLVEESEILTIQEAADLLKLAKQTLYQLCNKRAVPYYKKNKRLYFKRSELLDWIDEGKQQTQSELDAETINYLRKNQKD